MGWRWYFREGSDLALRCLASFIVGAVVVRVIVAVAS